MADGLRLVAYEQISPDRVNRLNQKSAGLLRFDQALGNERKQAQAFGSAMNRED